MTLFQRFILWLVVCCGSAAPSFVFGAMAYREPGNVVAMLCGILVFVVLYTWLTGTKGFARFRRKTFVDRTLKIGFGTRLFLSIAFPIGIYPDVFCGMLSMVVVMGDLDDTATPAQVFLITIVQGTILNILLAIYMLIVWGVQRLFMKKPAKEGLCKQCGYDLRASRDVCPECGEAIERELLLVENADRGF